MVAWDKIIENEWVRKLQTLGNIKGSINSGNIKYKICRKYESIMALSCLSKVTGRMQFPFSEIGRNVEEYI